MAGSWIKDVSRKIERADDAPVMKGDKEEKEGPLFPCCIN